MHLWDVPENPWYRFPVPGDNSGLGLTRAFPARFVLDDYLACVSTVELVKCVHVTAVTDPTNVEAESRWVRELAHRRGLPQAIIGTVDLKNPATIAATLDREARSPLFRGIRLLSGLDYNSRLAHDVIQTLVSRGLIYDAVARPGGGIADLARAAARHEDLVVVLEHTGWPRSTDAASFSVWREEIAQLAVLPNCYCKLSGLGMVVHSTSLAQFRSYFDVCIELFGAARCMFATNFPVDLCYGSAADLFEVFGAVAASCSAEETAQLFANTAEHVYRL
jgi:predicted TIM-barrel fold metal-dependent hydrolase